MRKGRFDEIFFVDLPDEAARAALLRLHAARRGLVLRDDELAPLVAASAAFSGAEIEQGVVSATYAAHAKAVPLDASAVLAEPAHHPAARRRHGRARRAPRAWASARAVPAR
ncbi:hypothetical protein ACFP82_00020 [Cellulomonas gelida]|uniref:hypothetical protein n=1 Tax=Cellulomonas gelida TaxID=1712 RepID=UPI00360A560D